MFGQFHLLCGNVFLVTILQLLKTFATLLFFYFTVDLI